MKKKSAASQTPPPRSLAPKSPLASTVEMNEIVLPSHTNALGTIFGGLLMSWIDIAAAICAQRHSRSVAVTASIDGLSFLEPVQVGELVILKARVIATGKTSMVVSVEVDSENPLSGNRVRCVTAFLNFVAFDAQKKPTEVPSLLLRTAAEKKLSEWAKNRRQILMEQLKDQPHIPSLKA